MNLSYQIKVTLNNFLFLFCISIAAISSVSAVERKVLHLEVKTETTPLPKITLSWDGQKSGYTITIHRRTLGQNDSASWGDPIATVKSPYSLYVDTKVQVGTVYEYKVYRPRYDAMHESVTMYVASGIKAPLVDTQGKILLVVDNTIAKPLKAELKQLEHDLAGDGWTVIRHDSPRHGKGSAKDLKKWIVKKYNEDSINTKMLFLFGHLPIVKSGYQAPDGHNSIPHATDIFYGDVNGKWTDSALNIPQINIPRDGIYDQNMAADFTVELQVGRVDLADMPSWKETEIELLRNYLRKDHLWRHGLVKDTRNGIVAKSTMIPYLSMEYGMLHSLYQTKDVFEVDALSQEKWVNWNVEATKKPYAWGVVFGDFDGKNYPNYDLKVTFAINFGSSKQKWELRNNPMRAILAMPNYGLVSAWGARPYWFFHHMGMGKTIGYSAYRTQNNYYAEYSPAGAFSFRGRIHVNLMGDPSLRLYSVLPPSNLSASINKEGNSSLSWIASPIPVEGYHVYKAEKMQGPFSRLTTSAIQSTNFEDTAIAKGKSYYMVRAIQLENVSTGSFYNPSQGIFASVSIDSTTMD